MLTKRQRNQIPIGIERFKTDHRMRDLEEAERQVIDSAMALSEALNGRAKLTGQWKQLMELDYACVALKSAQQAMEIVPEIPSWVEGVSYN